MARAHWSRLIEVHTAERDEFAKAPVGEAVTRDTLPALIELLADHTLGASRIMLVRALKRLRGPERDAALAQLREDSTFHAALGVRSKRSGERRTVVPRRGRPVHRTERPARASRSCARTPSRPYLRYWVSAKSPGKARSSVSAPLTSTRWGATWPQSTSRTIGTPRSPSAYRTASCCERAGASGE